MCPFIGSKEQPFKIFKEKEDDFYQAVIVSFIDLFDGEDESSEIVPEQEKIENSELVDE